MSFGKRELIRAKIYYDRVMREVQYKVGDRVFVWSDQLNKRVGSKVMKLWYGPYVVHKKLGHVGYEIESEMNNNLTKMHLNRRRRISDEEKEIGDPVDRVLRDSLILIKKINAVCSVQDAGTDRSRR